MTAKRCQSRKGTADDLLPDLPGQARGRSRGHLQQVPKQAWPTANRDSNGGATSRVEACYDRGSGHPRETPIPALRIQDDEGYGEEAEERAVAMKFPFFLLFPVLCFAVGCICGSLETGRRMRKQTGGPVTTLFSEPKQKR